MTGHAEPSADVHRTALFLRQLFVALLRVGFPERQAIAIVGTALSAVPPTPSAPTQTLSVEEITARLGRAS